MEFDRERLIPNSNNKPELGAPINLPRSEPFNTNLGNPGHAHAVSAHEGKELDSPMFARHDQGTHGQERIKNNEQARETSSVELAAGFSKLLSEKAQHHFVEIAQTLSFDEYLRKVYESPTLLIRNESQYTADMLRSFGFNEKIILGRTILDFALKNRPWQPKDLEDQVKLAGQEVPLYEFYLRCELYARQAHPNRMIIFHGPPGGGKTLLSETISAGLEEYSRNNAQGALYRLTFGFENDKQSKALGFVRPDVDIEEVASNDPSSASSRFRYIIRPPGNTDPVFLIPKDTNPNEPSPRELLYRDLLTSKKVGREFNASYLLRGELDSTSERIMEALLQYYNGDWDAAVKNHVRIERWTMSAKQGRGITSVRPSQDWNADIEPLQAKGYVMPPSPRELASAESDLYLSQSLPLSTSRGHLHFADLLRPNERDRGDADISRLSHLLETIEGGTTQIMSRRETSLVRTEQIHTLIRADSNDEHIEIKKTGPAWKSFSQRCDFLTVGLTTRFIEEARAHEARLERLLGTERPMAPHSLNTFALFVTATRLLKPDSEAYSGINKDFAAILKGMNVVEKALLLQEPVPGLRNEMNILRDKNKRWSVSELLKLKEHISDIAREYTLGVGLTRFSLYDGGIGVSTRAAQDLLKEVIALKPGAPFTAYDVCDALKKRRQYFEYYQEIGAAKEQYVESEHRSWLADQRTQGKTLRDGDIATRREGIRSEVEKKFPIPHPQEILNHVERYAKLQIQEDVYIALGMANMESMALVLGRYIDHVRVAVTKTGAVKPEYRIPRNSNNESASTDLMEDFEDRVLKEPFSNQKARNEYRSALCNRIANWAIANKHEDLEGNLENIFSDLRDKIKEIQQSWLHESLSAFKSQLEIYTNDSKAVARHKKGSPEQRRNVDNWERATKELIALGYPEDTILKHVFWAFNTEKEK